MHTRPPPPCSTGPPSCPPNSPPCTAASFPPTAQMPRPSAPALAARTQSALPRSLLSSPLSGPSRRGDTQPSHEHPWQARSWRSILGASHKRSGLAPGRRRFEVSGSLLRARTVMKPLAERMERPQMMAKVSKDMTLTMAKPSEGAMRPRMPVRKV